MKALFFDLDGTLWNAIPQLTIAYNIAMEKHHLPYHFNTELVRSFMGLTPEETAALLFPERSLKEGLDIFHFMYEEELLYLKNQPGELYQDVEKTLKILANQYPLYIVSNADKGYIETFLEGSQLGSYFKGHLAAGDTGLAKWQNILLLKEKENIDEVIYIGDTNKDKVESLKAGVYFIHAAYGFGVIENDPYKVDQFSSLPEVVHFVFNDK